MSHYLGIAATVLGTLAVLALAVYLYPILLLILFSLGGAGATRPLIDSLAARGIPRMAAILGAYALVIGILIVVLVLIAQPLGQETQRLFVELRQGIHAAQTHEADATAVQRLLLRLLPLVDQPWQIIGNASFDQWRLLLGWTSGVLETITQVVVALVLSMYWAADRLHFERLWLSLLPLERRVPAREAWREMEHEVGSYLRSEAIQCLAAGLVLGVAYRLVGYPYPTLLAVCAAVLWLIPWAGFLFTLAAATLLSLPTLLGDQPASAWGPLGAAMGLTAAAFLMLELALEPRLFNRRRYNSLLIVLLVLMFTELFGLVGLLLGPPIGVLVQTLSRTWLRHRLASESPPADVEQLDQRVAALSRSPLGLTTTPERRNLIERLQSLVSEAKAT
ncbi:MAG: AI-2E family transporter [Planctomycetaceae bacterium]|nr:AI-2E family transporter [Planctomycetaceae bacterium]